MTKVYQDETIGKIEFAYNGWTGRFNARINGIQATRVNKRMLRVETDAETYIISIYGNTFSGISFVCKQKTFQVTEKAPWYVYVLGFIPFIMTMVLGFLPSLAEAGIYYVGGALGGGISGGLSFLGIFFASFMHKHIFRLLILIGMIVVTFFTCWAIGTMIVGAASLMNA